MTHPPEGHAAFIHLNALLRGEFSAVESYNRALMHQSAESIEGLRTNRDCHATRIRVLIAAIEELGGTPEKSGGAWGALSELITSGAHLLGIDAVLAILESGEDRGLSEYNHALTTTDPYTRAIVETVLLPLQMRSSQRVKDLYRRPATSADFSSSQTVQDNPPASRDHA